MAEKITIRKNIPMPEAANRKGSRRYPFAEMQVGDCFEVAVGPADVDYTISDRRQKSIRSHASYHGHGLSRRFVTRIVRENTRCVIRCWRVS